MTDYKPGGTVTGRPQEIVAGKALTGKGGRLLGTSFVKNGIISEEQLGEALKIQARTKELLGSILVKLGYVTEQDVAGVIAEIFGLDYIDLDDTDIEPAASEAVPSMLAQRYGFIPLSIEGNAVHIVCDRPLEPQVTGNLRRLTGKQIVVHISTTSAVQALFRDMYSSMEYSRSMSVSMANPLLAPAVEGEPALEETVIEILDELLGKAIRERASDIHFEPAKERLRVRFRVDGIMREVETFPPEISAPLISRIKVLSNLNIAEKRSPQDGGFTFEGIYDTVDTRVSILPNIYGEKAVIRLLALGKTSTTFDSLGMEDDTGKGFVSMLKRPHGLILISGPTGSGKSTTLYGALLMLRSSEVNITTVEDPVEYKIEGITQVQVDQSRKITFATALRSILRQDPDIIMVGEIRDRETAEISLQASLTGHLVLATLHTNDAPSALTRLIDMGCEPFLVGSAVSGVVAQRLIRLNCESCKEAYDPTTDELKRFGASALSDGAGWRRGSGCHHCEKTGYRGRVGIFEQFVVDKTIRQEIMKNSSADRIREIAISRGMRPLLEDGILKVNRGQTTPEEILRVTVLE